MARGIYVGVNTTFNDKSLAEVSVGSLVKLAENGTLKNYRVLSKNYQNTGRVLLLRENPHTAMAWNTGGGSSYSGSTIDTWLTGTFFNTLSSKVQAQVSAITIPYTKSYGSSVSSISRKVFLLSATEVNFPSGGFNAEGTALSYFSSDSVRTAYNESGTVVGWWTRSPSMSDNGRVYYIRQVAPIGGKDADPSTSAGYYARPALTLPNTLKVLDTGEITGDVAKSGFTAEVARKAKKMYVGVENFKKVTLPTGYAQAAYIQSSGTQWIDTGFTPNQDTRVVMDVDVTANKTSAQWYKLFGGCTSYPSNAFGMWIRGDGGVAEDNYASSTANITLSDSRLTIDKNKNTTIVNGQTKTWTYSAFQSTNTLRIFDYIEVGTSSGGYFNAVCKLYSCKIYDNGTLVRDYIPCTNASGTAGLYDLVGAKFYGNAGTGTFTAGGTTPSVARRVRKGYIGIGGVARPFWGELELVYYGTIKPLSVARQNLAGGSIGNYAVFAGGAQGYSSNVVDAYDKSLTRSTPSTLKTARWGLRSGRVGDYLLFAGGWLTTSASVSSYVSSYTASLTIGVPIALNAPRERPASASIESHTIFAGGATNNSGSTSSSTVDAYDKSLTRTMPNTLTSSKANPTGGNIGNYAIIAGGRNGSNDVAQSTVDVYNTSLTKSTATALSVARYNVASTTIGGRALFAGGYNYSANYAYYSTVDAYDASLTRSKLTDLSSAWGSAEAITIGEYAIIAGGANSNGAVNTVNVYNKSLTRTVGKSLSKARNMLATATTGNYALFAGGGMSDVVDAFALM